MGLKKIFLLNLYYLNCSKSHFTNCQTMLEKPKMNKYIPYYGFLTQLMSVLQTSQAFILLHLLYVNSNKWLFSLGTNTLSYDNNGNIFILIIFMTLKAFS